ncbi:hypothetical protein [uncultured Kordia sp.]|uniref:hypothetical protein n=1 Tax=uncultured Kordia sp. TaxID=507699 RepID=UPI0026371D08|nr:hypothetical protein [uncultured Kordia sp.]
MQQEINTKNLTFYSQKAIGIATFIGGPLAAGYLIRENYKALNESEKGNKALIISIIITIALFALIFSIPEHIIEKIPKMIIPAIYTGATVYWVEQTFGAIFKQHEENAYAFFSRWKAAGIGILSLLVIGGGLFAYIYSSTDFETENLYNTQLQQFTKNENESLVFYDHLDNGNSFGLILELDNEVIPKWKENLQIVKNMDTLKGLDSAILQQNKILLRYSELRLDIFDLLKKALKEDTDKYDAQLSFLHSEIDKELAKLN